MFYNNFGRKTTRYGLVLVNDNWVLRIFMNIAPFIFTLYLKFLCNMGRNLIFRLRDIINGKLSCLIYCTIAGHIGNFNLMCVLFVLNRNRLSMTKRCTLIFCFIDRKLLYPLNAVEHGLLRRFFACIIWNQTLSNI